MNEKCVSKPPQKYYVLHGDGITDDSEALQALIDGHSVYRPDGTLVNKKGPGATDG